MIKKLYLLFALMAIVLTSAAQSEVRDENGAITSPAAGTSKVYNREGKVLVPVGFSLSENNQIGSVTMVFCEDGTVYMQHPLSRTLNSTKLNPDIWIKGKQEGDIISFPSQVIGYSTAFRTTVSIAMGDMIPGELKADPKRDEAITFKVSREGKILEQQGSSNTHVLGAFYDSDNDSYYYWDYETTLVLDNSAEHDPAVVPPSGLSTTAYIMHGYDAVAAGNGMGMGVSFNAQLGFDGDEAYLGQFSYYSIDKKLWLKGRKEGDKVVFPKEQYLYTDEDKYDYYFYALPKGGTASATQAEDLVLTYNPATGGYTSGQDIYINKEKLADNQERIERVEGVVMVAFKNPESEAIKEAPTGYTQITYQRHGQCMANNTGWLDCETVSLDAEVAWSPDRTIAYLKNPLTLYNNMEVWVKGTMGADGKLHVPLMQYVQKYEGYDEFRTGLCRILWFNKSQQSYTYVFDPTVQEITYTIDEDGFLIMDPLYEGEVNGQLPAEYIYGSIGGNTEFLWAGVGEAYSILTPVEGSETIIGEKEEENEEDKIDISTPVPGEEKNQYGIITNPGKGVESTYTRSGECYEASGTNVISGKQEGVAHIVECDGDVVYLQAPVSAYTKGYAATSWIRGVKKDGFLIFPQGQPIGYHDYYEDAVGVFMGTYDEEIGTIVADRDKAITFVIDEEANALALMGSNNVTPMGVFYCEDGEWTGYGDYRTVLTFKSKGHEEQTVAPSAKATLRHYTLTATDLEEGGKGYNAVLAFDENDVVYLSNFSFWANYSEEAYNKPVWIKGRQTAEGNLVFPKEQFLYTYSVGGDDFDLFFYGVWEPVEGAYALSDVTFTLNPATGAYTTEEDLLINWGKVTTSLHRAEQLTGAVLTPDESEGGKPFIIKEQPAGTLYSYRRSGVAFGYNDYGQVVKTEQTSDVDIVISHDRKFVYMHNPISAAIPAGGGSWISGTIDEQGNLHFPTMQWIDFNDEVGYGARTAAMIRVDDESGATKYVMLANIAEMTFTLNHETGAYTLDRNEFVDYNDADDAPRMIYGVVWSNDYSWAGYGDFDSVYTPNFEWVPEGIGHVNVNGRECDDQYFDLQGRSYVRQPKSGLFIQGGRKVIR